MSQPNHVEKERVPQHEVHEIPELTFADSDDNRERWLAHINLYHRYADKTKVLTTPFVSYVGFTCLMAVCILMISFLLQESGLIGKFFAVGTVRRILLIGIMMIPWRWLFSAKKRYHVVQKYVEPSYLASVWTFATMVNLFTMYVDFGPGGAVYLSDYLANMHYQLTLSGRMTFPHWILLGGGVLVWVLAVIMSGVRLERAVTRQHKLKRMQRAMFFWGVTMAMPVFFGVISLLMLHPTLWLSGVCIWLGAWHMRYFLEGFESKDNNIGFEGIRYLCILHVVAQVFAII